MAANLHISGLSGAAFSASPRPCLHVSAWSTPSTPLGPGSTPTRRLVCCSWGDRMQHKSPVVAASAMAAAGGLPQQNRETPSMLSVLGSTRPVDRIRYQAQLLFNYLDTDRDGKLSTEDLGQYVAYCNDRFGAGRFKLDELYTPLIVQDQGLSFEDFVDLFRQQVAALSTDAFLESQIKGPEIGKLLYKCAVPTKELAKALAIFKLLDFNNDGFIRVDEYSKAQGIEKKVFDSVLVDADENEDGFLTFEDFMDSYSRERPVLMSVAVMAAHTAAFWAVFNLPMDTVFKALLAGLLLLRPAIITNPVIKIYQIAAALLGRLRATAEVVKGGGQPDAL